ncbi:MAG: hypothetical protein O9327_02410 [Polaromonas sp.]|nr:hypothetical protein [Polaromonas sp.]
MNHPIRLTLLAPIVFAAITAPVAVQAQQLYKCEVGGRVEFRQAPCEASAKSESIKVRPAPAPTQAPTPRPDPSASAPSYKPTPSAQIAPNAPLPSQPAAPTALPTTQQIKSPTERMADTCLEWYRPLLRDPRGAYHRDATYDKGVLTLTIYATNGYGGYVQEQGRCEFKAGKLDDGWTKIHAKRLNWPTT